jgi:hypothetical protein
MDPLVFAVVVRVSLPIQVGAAGAVPVVLTVVLPSRVLR